MAPPKADGSHGAFWPYLHPDCLQIQNLEIFFSFHLLRERRERKSSREDISLIIRPFKIPEEREERAEGSGKEKGAQSRVQSLTTPILRGPSQPKPACKFKPGALSPEGGCQYFPHLLSNITNLEEEKEEGCEEEF